MSILTSSPALKAPVTKVFGISVNISIKAFCPPMCFLFLCGESCFYTSCRTDWVGWRLARGEDGRGWPVNFNEASLYGNSKNCLKYLLSFFNKRCL